MEGSSSKASAHGGGSARGFLAVSSERWSANLIRPPPHAGFKTPWPLQRCSHRVRAFQFPARPLHLQPRILLNSAMAAQAAAWRTPCSQPGSVCRSAPAAARAAPVALPVVAAAAGSSGGSWRRRQQQRALQVPVQCRPSPTGCAASPVGGGRVLNAAACLAACLPHCLPCLPPRAAATCRCRPPPPPQAQACCRSWRAFSRRRRSRTWIASSRAPARHGRSWGCAAAIAAAAAAAA